MHLLINKFKEILFSVLPITIIVIILNFTFVPLGRDNFIRFLIGAFLIIIGLSIFLFGVDTSISKIGSLIGKYLAQSNKIAIVGISGLVLGFFISIAEPDLHILANQVGLVTSGAISKNAILIVVSLGIAVILALGLFRILYNYSLKKFFLITYTLIFTLFIFSSSEFIAIAFDASGATTGAMAVPFVLAIALGVSSLSKESKSAEENSFGLVGIISAGAIIGVLLLGLMSKTGALTGTIEPEVIPNGNILRPFLTFLPKTALEIFIVLFPIILIFIIGQRFAFKESKKSVKRILLGSIYTFVGLVLFLVGVNAGFMEAGRIVGFGLAERGNNFLIILIAFLIGLVVILAEPAVYVLTKQIEEVTSGYIKRRVVLIALSIGVAVAVALAVIKIIVPGLELWHFLVPGYIIAMSLSFYVPTLFVGIAFDSGGVASGPMTATFILAFAQGIANATPTADVLADGFGIIAMVAMAPLIALQILGLTFKIKSKKGGKSNAI